jgi:hypothetical protein
MSLWWLYTILAIAAALTIAGTIILVGRQSEERGGYLDLTGIARCRVDGCHKPAKLGYIACRDHVRRRRRLLRAHARAHAQPFAAEPLEVGRALDWPGRFDAYLLGQALAGRDVFEGENGATVHAAPGAFREIPEGWHQLSETELARRVAQQQPRGADAA